jgi:hypothetical protein
MNDSNPNATKRTTLTLKGGTRRPPPAVKNTPAARPIAASKSKPGARWSDDSMSRMQADMDHLLTR